MRVILRIALEAHNDERDHRRRYEVRVERDLFDDWLVTVSFGRIGGGTHELRFGCGELESAQRVVRQLLQRRLSAPRRLGCPYRVRSISTSLDRLDGWIPQGLMLGAPRLSS